MDVGDVGDPQTTEKLKTGWASPHDALVAFGVLYMQFERGGHMNNLKRHNGTKGQAKTASHEPI